MEMTLIVLKLMLFNKHRKQGMLNSVNKVFSKKNAVHCTGVIIK